MTETRALSHVLLDALKAYGAREIFGIPGDFALPFFKQIEATGTLPLITLSHEPGLGFAADAAARIHSNLSVAAVTYGAGALNMVNPVAQAYSEKSPMVVISGAPGAEEKGYGLYLHHQVKDFGSQYRIFQEITQAQAILDDPMTAPGEIARVLSAARLYSRPVYIEFPRDMVMAPVSPVPPFTPPPINQQAAAACAREVLAALKTAERPALLLGVEIRRYGLEARVADLARRLGLPVATTFLGRGLLADDDAPLVGTYMGLAGEPAVKDLVEGADCLLVLGAILCDTNFGASERALDHRAMIHAFDRQVRFAHHLYPEVSLEALLEALIALAEPLGQADGLPLPAPPRDLPRDGQGLTPLEIARAINDLFAQKGRMPIASDIGDCLFTTLDIENTELVGPAYYATMGPGVPMGLGLEAATGRRPLILVGDGAFQMTGWELGNARRLGLSPIVVVFNNAAWGMLKAFQEETGYNDLDSWDFAALAGHLGGVGHRATNRAELWTALTTAADDPGRWHLIDAIIPRDVYSPTLSRFVGTMKQRSALRG